MPSLRDATRTAGYAYALSITNIIKLNKESSIGSGSVESAVKQVDRRTKISGAQWKRENVAHGSSLCLPQWIIIGLTLFKK